MKRQKLQSETPKKRFAVETDNRRDSRTATSTTEDEDYYHNLSDEGLHEWWARQLGNAWAEAIGRQTLLSPELRNTLDKVRKQRLTRIIYPPEDLTFEAFRKTNFDSVRAVIVGDDPYHGEGQACGLSFSVPRDVKIPPSLRNIYKEFFDQLPTHGDLTDWTQQGVLLLNSCLTVEKGKPRSHAKFGWSTFTDAAIRAIGEKEQNIVFFLWGNPAREKAKLLKNTENHCILVAGHPSPLSIRYFRGCNHFNLANDFFISKNESPISWSLNLHEIQQPENYVSGKKQYFAEI